MFVRRIRRWGAGAVLAGGTAVATGMLGLGSAHADGGTDQIHGWMVTPTGSSSSDLLPGATLSDPSDSLGLGTSVAGGWNSVPATPLSNIGSNDLFNTPLTLLGSPNSLEIDDNWLAGVDESLVNVGGHNSTLAFLVPAAGGNEVVDLLNIARGDAPPPLFNPAATGPIDVGGLELASPQDGALLNDLSDALFKGDTADFSKATTLFDDLLGTAPSNAAAAAADPTNVLDATGSAAAASGADDTAVSAGDAAANGALVSAPDDPLSQASANLAEASSLITTQPEVAPAAVVNLFGIIDGAVGAGFGQGIAEKTVDKLTSAEAVISAHDSSASTQVEQLFFDPLNQDWENTSEALLHADQAYEAALASGSGLNAADASLFTADFQALGDAFDSAPIIEAANLINLF